MGRWNLPMELINDEKKRKLVSIRRKECIFKKARELATLCDINVSMIISSEDKDDPEIFPQDPRLLNDMINVYKRDRANGKLRSFSRDGKLRSFSRDGKKKIVGDLGKTEKEKSEGSHPTRAGFMDKNSLSELKDSSFGLGLKINKVKARIELLKSKKISDSLKMPLDTPNPITIMTCMDHNNNNNSFVSDHGVGSSRSSNANVDSGYKPVMLMGQNLLAHESNSMVSTMSKDDDNNLSDGANKSEVLQQLGQPQCLDLLSCFRT